MTKNKKTDSYERIAKVRKQEWLKRWKFLFVDSAKPRNLGEIAEKLAFEGRLYYQDSQGDFKQLM